MTDADLPFCAALYASTRAEEVATSGWPAQAQAAFLEQQHQAQHSHYSAHFAQAERLIVEQGGQAIGRLYLDERPEHLHIVDISLMPASRRGGVGGAILQDVLGLARDQGRKVSIHVEKTNPARRLYERLGFRLVDDRGVYDLMEAVPG